MASEGKPGCSGPGVDGEQCARVTKTRELCSGHAEQRRLGRELAPLKPKAKDGEWRTCTFPGCRKRDRSRGLCWGHAEQRDRGQELRPLRERSKSSPVKVRDEQGRKQCSTCTAWLDEAEFNREASRSDGLSSYCRECARHKTLARKYGISAERYEAMLAEQGGGCAVCGIPEGRADGRALAVDHDHSCCPGKKTCGSCIRGLLCGSCNTGIGLLADTPARLRAAAAYLEQAS